MPTTYSCPNETITNICKYLSLSLSFDVLAINNHFPTTLRLRTCATLAKSHIRDCNYYILTYFLLCNYEENQTQTHTEHPLDETMLNDFVI